MSMRFSEKLLLAKLEGSYGVDAGPDVATDVVLASGLDITPMNAETAERDILTPWLGGSEQMLYNLHVKVSFKTELQNGGTVGTPPPLSTVLRLCGLAEVINAGTSVEYTPVSESFESGTLYFYLGSTLHAITGVRGNIKTELSAGIPYLSVEATGLFNDPSKVIKPTGIDWSAWKKPLVLGNGNTGGFALHGYAAIPHALEIDLGQAVDYQASLTKQSVEIGSRSASGSVTIEAPELDSKDYFAAAKESQTGTLTITHGTAAGYICEISAPKVQLMSPSYTDLKGVVGMKLDMALLPVAGNDELKLTFR